MNRIYTYLIILLTIPALVVMAGCTRTGDTGKRSITVSIEPQRYLLERITGDLWQVNTLLDKGADPENFDPPMSALRSLHDSGIYFTVGHIPFEDAVISRINSDTLTVIDTSEGIDLIEGTHCQHNHSNNNHSHDDTDPHVWSSVKNARVMASNMLEAVTAIDPLHSEYYKENYHRLITSLDSLDKELTGLLKPHKSTAFLVWHPSLSYFARDYDLEQLSIGMDNKEMLAESLKDRIDEARHHNAAVFFIQADMDSGRSESIARQAGAKTVSINPLAYEWADQLRHIARSIADSAEPCNLKDNTAP